jgi:hypothetical protein
MLDQESIVRIQFLAERVIKSSKNLTAAMFFVVQVSSMYLYLLFKPDWVLFSDIYTLLVMVGITIQLSLDHTKSYTSS